MEFVRTGVCQQCDATFEAAKRGPVARLCLACKRRRNVENHHRRSDSPESEAARALVRRRWDRWASSPDRTVEQQAFRFCAHCQTALTTNHPKVRYCSAVECVKARNRERMRKGKWNQAERHKRRARLRSAESESFQPTEVYERDGWVCQLCESPVDPDLDYPDPMSVSLDHVTPIARGGAHTMDNTQCAHLVCNLRKGARTEAA